MEVFFRRRSHILIDNCLKRHQVQECLRLPQANNAEYIELTNVE